MTTTVLAASSATLNVASVPRKAVVVPQRVAHREVAAQEEVPHEAHREAAIPQGNRTVVAVAPAVMTTTTMHRAAEAEAAEDNGYV